MLNFLGKNPTINIHHDFDESGVYNGSTATLDVCNDGGDTVDGDSIGDGAFFWNVYIPDDAKRANWVDQMKHLAALRGWGFKP